MKKCFIVESSTERYILRRQSMRRKYGDMLKKGAQYYYLCGNEKCIESEHLILMDTVFEEVGAKPCSSCGEWKAKEEFYPANSSPNGVQSICRDCISSKYGHMKREKFDSLLDKYNYLVVRQDGCWGWNGPKNQQGYALLSLGDIHTYAHRFSYELFIGLIPGNMYVYHRCDSPICTNPDHLFIGEHQDDIVEKNKNRKGPNTYNAKVNEDIVREIRKDCIPGDSEFGFAPLGRKYGISPATVRGIYIRDHWKHIE